MSKKRIAVVTGTRAEYHLLFPLLKKIASSDRYELKLIVTGAHLDEEYGKTFRDIESDGIPIAYKIPILDNPASDSKKNIIKAMCRAMEGTDDCIEEIKPDLMILLGDRYEILSAAIACTEIFL